MWACCQHTGSSNSLCRLRGKFLPFKAFPWWKFPAGDVGGSTTASKLGCLIKGSKAFLLFVSLTYYRPLPQHMLRSDQHICTLVLNVFIQYDLPDEVYWDKRQNVYSVSTLEFDGKFRSIISSRFSQYVVYMCVQCKKANDYEANKSRQKLCPPLCMWQVL